MLSKTPFDMRADTVGEWIDALDEIDADTQQIAAVRDQVDIYRDAARRHTSAHRKLEEAKSARVAMRRAAERGVPWHGKPVKAKHIAALESEIEDAQIAETNAAGQVWRLLARRRDANLDLLRPAYTTAASTTVDAFDQLGGRVTIEDAARRGLAQQWLDLENAAKVISTIHKIHAQWVVDGIVTNRGKRTRNEHENVFQRYSSNEFYYGDRLVAEAIPGGGPFTLAARFTAAGAALRSIPEIDELYRASIDTEDEAASIARAMTGKPTTWDGDRLTAQTRAAKASSIGYRFQ